MTNPFLGELRIMSFNFAPRGWASCNGQLLPINQNQALFSLLGTTYGGDGITTFALPNLQGRVPIHFGSDALGNSYALGQGAGETAHMLTTTQLPAHLHGTGAGSSAATIDGPANGWPAMSPANPYVAANAGSQVALAATTVGNQGGSQPHSNLQPLLVLTFCIATVGIFPSRN